MTESGAAKKSIMIVEDDRDILDSLKQLLEGEGYNVHFAGNGAEALDVLRKLSDLPGLILLDLMMPVKDGFTFRAEQVQDANLKHIPVTIMTADANIQEKSVRTHADSYIRKPIDIELLLSTIKQYIKA